MTHIPGHIGPMPLLDALPFAQYMPSSQYGFGMPGGGFADNFPSQFLPGVDSNQWTGLGRNQFDRLPYPGGVSNIPNPQTFWEGIQENPLTAFMPGLSTASYWDEMGPVGKGFSLGADALDLAGLIAGGIGTGATRSITTPFRRWIQNMGNPFSGVSKGTPYTDLSKVNVPNPLDDPAYQLKVIKQLEEAERMKQVWAAEDAAMQETMADLVRVKELGEQTLPARIVEDLAETPFGNPSSRGYVFTDASDPYNILRGQQFDAAFRSPWDPDTMFASPPGMEWTRPSLDMPPGSKGGTYGSQDVFKYGEGVSPNILGHDIYPGLQSYPTQSAVNYLDILKEQRQLVDKNLKKLQNRPGVSDQPGMKEYYSIDKPGIRELTPQEKKLQDMKDLIEESQASVTRQTEFADLLPPPVSSVGAPPWVGPPMDYRSTSGFPWEYAPWLSAAVTTPVRAQRNRQYRQQEAEEVGLNEDVNRFLRTYGGQGK